MATPAVVLEARQHHAPSPDQVYEHWVAPGEHAIVSGWLQEPKATLYIRTGLQSAKMVCVPNFGRITLSNNSSKGLQVETQDPAVVIQDLDIKIAERLRGSLTIPMMLRNEHCEELLGEKLKTSRRWVRAGA